MTRIKPKEYLQNLSHIVVAVANDDGLPWAVPVAVQKYSEGVVTWISKTDTVHSRAIEQNPIVALLAYTTKDSLEGEYGFYARAEVSQFKYPVIGLARYKAKITEAWYNDADHKKTSIEVSEL